MFFIEAFFLRRLEVCFSGMWYVCTTN